MRYTVVLALCCVLCAVATGTACANGVPHPGGYIVAVYPYGDDLGCPAENVDPSWEHCICTCPSPPCSGDNHNEYVYKSGMWKPWPQPGDGFNFPFQRWHPGGNREQEHYATLTDVDGNATTNGIYTHGKAMAPPYVNIDPHDCPQDGCGEHNSSNPSGGYPAMEWYFTHATPASQLSLADYYQAKVNMTFIPHAGANVVWVRVCYQDLSDFQQWGVERDPTSNAWWHVVGGAIAFVYDGQDDFDYHYSDPVAMTWPSEYANRVLFIKGWSEVQNGPHPEPGHWPSRELSVDELRLGGYDGP